MDETPVSELTEEQVVRRYDRFVEWVIDTDLRLAGTHMATRSDMIQEGRIGLLQAFRSFDESKGVLFLTYARPRIRGSIQDFLRRIDPMKRALRERYREVDRDDLPDRYKLALSLDGLISVAGEGIRLWDQELLEDTSAVVEADDRFVLRGFDEWLQCQMSARHWDLYRRWRDGATLKKAGESVGVTESRACQIIAGVEKKAKEYGFLMRCEDELAS